MDLIRYLRKESDSTSIRLMVIATFSGIINALLVVVIINAAKEATPGQLHFRNLLLFASCLAGFIYCRNFTLTQTVTLTELIISKLRTRIINKIRHANLEMYEKTGKVPIYTALSKETFTLSEAATWMISSFSSAVMLLGATLYIAWLSRGAFLLTLGCIAGGVFIYNVRRRSIDADLRESSQKENHFFELLNHLLDGFKEVKMNWARNEDLNENYLYRSVIESEQLKVRTGHRFAQIAIFSQCFFYALIATVIFILPSAGKEDSGVTMQVATIILFMIGPLSEVVAAMPVILRGNTAIATIEKLETDLDQAVAQEQPFEILARSATGEAFSKIDCEGVTYAYEGEKEGEFFRLGPLDLTLHRGEILFIVGGNGSGKSTFLKVFTGLYPHREGNLRMDERMITPSNLPRYRSLFSTVFTDFHLFDRLYGIPAPDPLQIEDILQTLELQDKTSVLDGRFTTLQLSTGQRKRLALMVSLLERRPILIFDEVAADQDPHFRKCLYEVMLPKWQKEGKTVLAVTHDDAYFHVADRVLKMEYGKFTSVNGPAGKKK